MNPATSHGWHPVATTHDLVPRTIYRTSLTSRELVVWRADDGFVNVWENRCLHRGVRLSIGSNDGAELICRYHGWRYSNRSGGCTYVPAHPADSPPRTIQNQSLPAIERHGLIWSGDDPIGEVPEPKVLRGETLGLRNLPINAPADVVVDALTEHRFKPSALLGSDGAVAADRVVTMTAATEGWAVTLTSTVDDERSSAVFFVQPVEVDRCVVRPVLGERPADELSVLRHHADALGRFKRAVEAQDWPRPDPQMPVLETPVVLSASTTTSRPTSIKVEVVAKEEVAKDVMSFEFAPLERGAGTSATAMTSLPSWQPGDHIDVHLGNGLVRQYSLTNRPGQSDRYRIGVKLDPASRGGSVHLHTSVHIGDTLTVSEPRSGFPLRRNLPHTIFLAGGIGITPLLSMAHALASMPLDFACHVFAASEADVAFESELAGFGVAVTRHLGLSPDDTVATIAELLARPASDTQVYACGPPPMLDAIRAVAADAGWPDQAIRFEYFTNTTELDDSSSFTIELARSARTLTVPAGSSILDVLRANDVPIVSSCEQGACGTCVASVIDGEPHHQDVYLSASERDAGRSLLTCVSRARSERLVLDL